jgi:hypothetical protein
MRVKTARDKRTKASRELLQSYVLVLAFVDEKQRKNYRLVVRGKTGERDAIFRSVAAKRLDNIWQSVVWQIRAGYCSPCLMAHRLHH